MRCCQRESCPLAPMGSALFAVHGLLQQFKALQSSAVGARVLNRFPRRERGKVQEAQVNANGFSTGGSASSSTSQEKMTYQWLTSRLMVAGKFGLLLLGQGQAIGCGHRNTSSAR